MKKASFAMFGFPRLAKEAFKLAFFILFEPDLIIFILIIPHKWIQWSIAYLFLQTLI